MSETKDEREFLEGLTLERGSNGVGYNIELGIRIGVRDGSSSICDLNNRKRAVWYNHGPAERDMVVTFARVLEHAFRERFGGDAVIP